MKSGSEVSLEVTVLRVSITASQSWGLTIVRKQGRDSCDYIA